MIKENQFSLRSLFVCITVVGLLLGGFLAFERERRRLLTEARRAAIREGRIPPEIIQGVLITPHLPKNPE